MKKHKTERCNWNSEDIIILKIWLNSNNIFLNNIKDAIDDIIDFGLPYQDDFLLNYDISYYYHNKGINKLFNEKIHNPPLTFDEIINEFIQLNKNVDNNLISELKNSYENFNKLLKTISKKSNKEIYDWSETVKKYKSYNINEMIAYINETIYRSFKYYLRPTQIISLLLVNK